MKNLIFKPLLAAAIVAVSFTGCDDDDDDNDLNISNLPSAITSYISENYPNATITSAELEANGDYDVEILDGTTQKDVLFDSAYEWIYTEWDVAVADHPTNVTTTISNTYSDYTIDDAEYYETSDGDYYYLELEKSGSADIYVKVDTEGNIIE